MTGTGLFEIAHKKPLVCILFESCGYQKNAFLLSEAGGETIKDQTHVYHWNLSIAEKFYYEGS